MNADPYATEGPRRAALGIFGVVSAPQRVLLASTAPLFPEGVVIRVSFCGVDYPASLKV
jgi:hypothetical protein